VVIVNPDANVLAEFTCARNSAARTRELKRLKTTRGATLDGTRVNCTRTLSCPRMCTGARHAAAA